MSDEHLFTGLLGEVRLVYDKEKRTIVPHPGLEARWDQIGPIPSSPELEEKLARVAAYAEDECKRLDGDPMLAQEARVAAASAGDLGPLRKVTFIGNPCAEVGLPTEPVMHEYRFDAQATVCIKVRALSREHAERVIRELEGSDLQDMTHRDAEIVEISVSEHELYQVDGVDVDDGGEPLDLGDVVRSAVITTVRPDQCVIPMVGPMSSGIEPVVAAYNRRCGPATVWHAGHEPRQELDGDALIKAIGDGVLGAGELTHDERLIWHEYLQRSALSVYESRVRLDRARYEGKVELDSVDE